MRYFFILSVILLLSSCTPAVKAGYIKSEKSYTRQIQAPIDDVYAAVKAIVERHGWKIDALEDPSVYERNEYTERVNQQMMLLFISQKGSAHLNIYLYQVNKWTDVLIRVEAVKPRVVVELLDEIEHEIGG